VWLPQSEWSNHPKDKTGKERPPSEWNWPRTDWINGQVPNPRPYKYPYGGEEYRHEPRIDDPVPMALEQGAAVNPLSRPVASWSKEDLRRVMASPAYWQTSHPGRAQAHAMVREWFKRAEASAAGRAHATRRSVPEQGTAAEPAGGGCEVPVRGHTRKGGEIEVDAHCRSRPAA
jgi:hypothetical protein